MQKNCIHVKVLERDVVIRVWSLEQSLKDHKVVPRQEPALRDVCDAKKSSELRTTDTRQVALGSDSIDELFTVQKPGTQQQRRHRVFSQKVQARQKKNLKDGYALFTFNEGFRVRVKRPPPALYL